MIKITKLITGEELIGDVEEKDTSISIKQPCAVQIMVTRENMSPAMSLMPYAFYTQGHEVAIEKKNIIWVAEPVKEVYNQYNKLFGSGIQLPGIK